MAGGARTAGKQVSEPLQDKSGSSEPVDRRDAPPEEEEPAPSEGSHNRPEFPDRPPRNRDRRAEKLRAAAQEAPSKTYETRARSVRTSNTDVLVDKTSYLRDLYTNDEAVMVCQVCKEKMPFKLDDGSYYFEAVECVRGWGTEHRENYLALCPICSAKYQFANGTSERRVLEAILATQDRTITVLLARRLHTARFNSTHLLDLSSNCAGRHTESKRR